MAVGKLFSSTVGDVTALVASNPNLIATTDPTASNDITQGYSAGSVWYNATGNRWWECVSSAAGAAVWSFSGAAYGAGGSNPSAEVTQFGSGAGLMAEEGNVFREVVASRNPGGTGSDYVVGTYTLPASSFDVTGRGINLIASGGVANNTNAKRVKIYFGCTTATIGSAVTGGTVVADTGAYSTTGAVGWALEANVFKYGAAGSNTQIGLHVSAQIGAVVGSLIVPIALTSTENAAIIIAVTANATTAATDIVYNWYEVNALN